MEKQDSAISARNLGCMIAVITLSSLLIVGLGNIGQDVWIGIVVAAIFAIPLVALYSRIVFLNPGLNIFEIIERRFSKAWAFVATALLSWYAVHACALVTRNFSAFVNSISLEHTPSIFIMMSMTAVGGYLAVNNFKTLGRWSSIILIVISGNLIFTFGFSFSSIELSNIKPIMEHSFQEISSMSLSFGVIAFAETALVLAAFGCMKSEDKAYKAYAIGIGYGAILLTAVVVRNILVLGGEMISVLIFPSYVTARIVRPGTFFEHIESIVSFNLILTGITKIAVCLKAASIGIAKLLKTEADASQLVIPSGLLSLSVCVTSFSNMQELIAFAGAYRYYAPIFTVLIPVVLWIKSESGRKSVE